MKEENIIKLFGVSIVVLGLIYFSTELKTKTVQNTQVLIEPVKNTVFSSIENNLNSLEIQQDHKKVETKDIKVIAKTNKEAEKLASKFYNEVFSIVGLEDGFINIVEAGESISVNNYFDITETSSQFIPLYANNKVVGVSIFREYSVGEKELGRMTQINETWYSYPPVMPYDAEFVLNTNYPTLTYTPVSGYYFIEDGETPYYLYEGSDGDSTNYYLISAYNKDIVVKKDRNDKKSIEETSPVKLSENGLLDLDNSVISNLTDNELSQLKADVELTNKYINEGIMKFDENMNIIYDRRIKENNDIFSSGENNQYFESGSSGDEKMDKPDESASLIK